MAAVGTFGRALFGAARLAAIGQWPTLARASLWSARSLLPAASRALTAAGSRESARDVVERALSLACSGSRDARARLAWDGIVARGVTLVDELKPKQIIHMAWACSKAPINMAPMMARLAPRALLCVPKLDGKELAMLAYAFAKARVSEPGLFAAIAQQAEARMVTFSAGPRQHRVGVCDCSPKIFTVSCDWLGE